MVLSFVKLSEDVALSLDAIIQRFCSCSNVGTGGAVIIAGGDCWVEEEEGEEEEERTVSLLGSRATGMLNILDIEEGVGMV